MNYEDLKKINNNLQNIRALDFRIGLLDYKDKTNFDILNTLFSRSDFPHETEMRDEILDKSVEQKLVQIILKHLKSVRDMLVEENRQLGYEE